MDNATMARLLAETADLLEIDGGDGNGAAIGERLPIGFEIVTLESSTANLFGEKAIFDGMVYVLEEMAVDSRIDAAFRPAGVHQQDGYPRFFGGRSRGPAKDRPPKDGERHAGSERTAE